MILANGKHQECGSGGSHTGGECLQLELHSSVNSVSSQKAHSMPKVPLKNRKALSQRWGDGCIDSCHPATATAGEAQTLQGEHPEIQQPAWGWNGTPSWLPWGGTDASLPCPLCARARRHPCTSPANTDKVIPSQKRPRGEPAS